MLRRLFAFLFTHTWEVRPPNVYSGVVHTVMECQHCGAIEEYPMLDQAAFVRVYRMRGCTGSAQRDGRGERP